jgi:hypothetical protein
MNNIAKLEDYLISKKEKLKNNNIYISLYGKTTLDAIENEVFLKAYYKSLGKDEDKKDVVEKLSSTFSSLTGAIDQFSDIKISPFVDFLNKLNQESKDNKAEEFMKDGLVICFDDFERKSTNINLNDLFGFITNLSLQYKAMVIVILNDDIFEGKDKVIFKNLKEKSVNKFLKFEPSKQGLFNIIFKKYKIDDKYKNTIFTAIEDMGILNARIYENILENFQEYFEENKNMTDTEVRYFVLTTINFNLNHIVFKFYDYHKNMEDWNLPSSFIQLNCSIDFLNILDRKVKQNTQQINTKLELVDLMKSSMIHEYKSREDKKDENFKILPTSKLDKDIDSVNKYANLIWFFWLLDIKLNYRANITLNKQKNINNFIETGIF